ncbi:3-deoxy-D-manno-octulosonic acid transferase [Kangiella sp. TOML190]|uniref:3-deoxy-D-manno-octulosonic acid transferase n=1 Tax=Kangiella sp. TOML190 TaxID=2931351 RepID=UPI0020410805|nr:glycosyltransferase N-terminal domain-containing protein [Kangiella sp. TOML190]
MIRILYTLLYYLLSPLMCVRWFIKSLRPPQYREPFRQRFGFVTFEQTFDIWIHAVSVGETSGAISLINRLLANQADLKILVTTTTPTGAKLLHESVGHKVSHCYSPCDLPGTIKRFIGRIKPKLVIIMETELWPNWINYISSKKTPIILANARLSETSKQKYLWFSQTSGWMLNQIQQILAVNEADAKRFEQLGVDKKRLKVVGNLKFDAEFSCNGDGYFSHWTSSDYIWIAASTHQGEDEIILQAHQQLLQQVASAKLVLVPRHPERFQSVEKRF